MSRVANVSRQTRSIQTRLLAFFRHDFTEHVSANGIMLPSAGVAIGVDEDACTKGSHPGTSKVIQFDDRRSTSPQDFQVQRYFLVSVAVLDSCGETVHVGGW